MYKYGPYHHIDSLETKIALNEKVVIFKAIYIIAGAL